MGGTATHAGRLARARGIMAVCWLAAACGGAPASPGSQSAEPAQACQQLATAYYAIARNKDLGSTREDQLMLVRQVAFEDPTTSVESLAFMQHVVDLVYRYPDEDAEAIRQRILADCEIDSDGKPVLRTYWTQP